MREIKFRAWDNIDLVMVDWEYFSNGRMNDFLSKELYLMQYTGFKDKRGVDVYEKDIYTFDWRRNHKNRRYFIVEDMQSFFEEKGLDEGEYGWSYDDLLVVGDVCQNPELLK